MPPVRITKNVVGRLAERFGLLDTAFQLGLFQNVQLTSDVDDLLVTTKQGHVTTACGGAGSVTLFTVPVGKRWEFIALSGEVSAGTATEVRIWLPGYSTTPVCLYKAATPATIINYTSPVRLKLPAGAVIGIGTSAAAVTIYGELLYTEEDYT